MPGVDIVDGEHARPLAAAEDGHSGVGTDSKVIEQPLDIDGQVPARDQAGHRNRVLHICGLLPEVERCDFWGNLEDWNSLK